MCGMRADVTGCTGAAVTWLGKHKKLFGLLLVAVCARVCVCGREAVAPIKSSQREFSSELFGVKKETGALCICTRIPSMFEQQTDKVFNNVFFFFFFFFLSPGVGRRAASDTGYTCRHGQCDISVSKQPCRGTYRGIYCRFTLHGCYTGRNSFLLWCSATSHHAFENCTHPNTQSMNIHLIQNFCIAFNN